MRITIKSGLIFAGIWILFKMIFFWTGMFEYNVAPAVLLNMLFVLLAISVGLYLHKRQETEDSSALSDIKNGMTAGVPYAMIVSVFIYFYYANIDPGFNQHQIAEAHMGIKQMLDEPGGLEKTRESQPEFEILSKEEIYEQLKSGPEGFYKASSTMTLSMLALLLLATLNSIFVTVIYRRVVFKNTRRKAPPEQ